MKKLDALRQHLLASVPSLRKNPEQLLTFIEDGEIEFHRGQNLSHQYRIPVKIVITDFAGNLNTLVVPLLQWLSHYQPDLDPATALRFQAEILSNNAYDIAFEVVLTERVVAKVDCDNGRINVENRLPEFPIDPCVTQNWQLYIKSVDQPQEYDLVAEWQSPPSAQV